MNLQQLMKFVEERKTDFAVKEAEKKRLLKKITERLGINEDGDIEDALQEQKSRLDELLKKEKRLESIATNKVKEYQNATAR